MRCLLIFFLLSGMSYAQDDRFTSDMANGKLWLNLSDTQRIFYAGAIRDMISYNEIMGRNKPSVDRLWADGFTTGDYVKELAEFYKDAENLLIPVPLAFDYCTEKLKGRHTKAELDQALITFRSVALKLSKVGELPPMRQ